MSEPNKPNYFYIPRCEQLRIGLHYSRNKFASMCDVDSRTLKKIETNHGVTDVPAKKVFDKLKELKPTLKEEEEVFALDNEKNPYKYSYLLKNFKS